MLLSSVVVCEKKGGHWDGGCIVLLDGGVFGVEELKKVWIVKLKFFLKQFVNKFSLAGREIC